MKNSFQNASQEEWKAEKESGIRISARLSRPFAQLPSDDHQICQCKSAVKRTVPGDNNLCLECGKMLEGANRENIKNACFDCGKPSVIRADRAEADDNFRCIECDDKYISHLQEKLAKENEKNQQVTNLQEQLNQKERQLTESSQQLEIERQAKKEIERSLEESKIQQEQTQNELIQLREELVKVGQELTQVQGKLKEQMEKSPQTNAEQLVEKLEKTGKDLTASQKLVQNPKLSHRDIIEVKNQLDSSRQILAAAAAHTKTVEHTTPRFKNIEPTRVHEEKSNKNNYLSYYLIGGGVTFGFLALGLFF